jgi:hypothetical protein
VKETRSSDAFGGIDGEPEGEIALVEVLVGGNHAAPHPSKPTRGGTLSETGVHAAE